MNYTCQDINKITNPGLKRLYEIRCNRYVADESKPIVINNNNNSDLDFNYFYLLFLLLLIILIVWYYHKKQKEFK